MSAALVGIVRLDWLYLDQWYSTFLDLSEPNFKIYLICCSAYIFAEESGSGGDGSEADLTEPVLTCIIYLLILSYLTYLLTLWGTFQRI